MLSRHWLGREREAGQASILIVGALLITLAFVGLGVDGARLFTARRDLQGVADAAALAGASAIDEDVYRTSAGAEVRLDPAVSRSSVDGVLRASGLPAGTNVDVSVGPDRVEVKISRRVEMVLLGIIGTNVEQIGAAAAASPRTQ